MFFSTATALTLTLGYVAASPLGLLEERAGKTSSSFVAAYPYTASVCQVTPSPSPSAVFHCNSYGHLNKPSILVDDIYTGTYIGCADICQQAQECISFGFNSSTTLCTLYDRPLTDMGLITQKTGAVQFANRHCFNCAGTTTVTFTVKPSTTPPASPTMPAGSTTAKGTTTAKGSTTKATATGKGATTVKGTSTKTSASPTQTFTAGPVNIVSGGNFTNENLGGFQASLTGATGSFTQLGDHYAYCCTSQLLGLDAVCVLSQNLETPVGTQYNVGFSYQFNNKLTGLSTITAPFSLGVIQQVLGSSTPYQSFSGRYFALTDPSLYVIALNVPLGGNSVCITNITVSPF